MVSKISGLSYSLPGNAAETKQNTTRFTGSSYEEQRKRQRDLHDHSLKDEFGRSAALQEQKKNARPHRIYGPGDGIEKLLDDLYERSQPKHWLSLDDDDYNSDDEGCSSKRPGLKHEDTFRKAVGSSAAPSVAQHNAFSESDELEFREMMQPLLGGLRIQVPSPRWEFLSRPDREGNRDGSQELKEEESSKEPAPRAVDSPENPFTDQLDRPARGRHHHRNRPRVEDAQAAIRELHNQQDLKEKRAGDKIAAHEGQMLTPHASQEELLDLMQIPYQTTVINQGEVLGPFPPGMTGRSLKDANQIVVGDMHGSFHKLMETLVLSDMVEMPPKAAKEFVSLANRADERDLTLEQLNQVHNDLHQVISTMRWKGGDRKLILLGDMLCDRGPLDTVTLDIVNQLRSQAPDSIVALASNHDHSANSYLTAEKPNTIPEQSVSMFRSLELAQAINKGPELINQYYGYLENSKLMHLDRSSGTLMTHAPVSMAQLRELDFLLKESGYLSEHRPLVDDIKDLDGVQTYVDAANQLYKDYIQQSRRACMNQARLEEMSNEDYDWERQFSEHRMDVEPVLLGRHGFLWTRNGLDKREDLPFRHAGVKTLVHGHDQESFGSPFSVYRNLLNNKDPDFTVVTLDQEVRKGPQQPDYQRNRLYILS